MEDKDFRLSRIFEEAIGAITNLDSKLFKTLRYLFFKPGALTSEFERGIRVPYMKPFQIFILANIFFFIFLSEIDIFRTPSKWFFVEHYDGVEVLKQVREIVAAKGISQEEVAVLYDAKSSNLAKGFIFLLLPIIALIAALLHWRQKIAFGKHIIFSIHYFSFVLVIAVLWTELIDLIVREFDNNYYVVPIQTIISVYLILAFRQFYKDNWAHAIWKGLLGTLLIGIAIQVYRMSINIWTLNHLLEPLTISSS